MKDQQISVSMRLRGYIRTAFSEFLNELDWMNDDTKILAREKAEAMNNWIGYPDYILDNDKLNTLYKNVTTDKNAYFENVLNNLKRVAASHLRNLREPYDKNVWLTAPSTVNALYSPILNNISRQYNKEGDLKQLWKQNIIDNFKAKAQCLVDQYDKFLVPEANMKMNGINTQGENISDNGGLKQSYRAYRSWVEKQGKEEPKLPGLDISHDQLFFLNFAQILCNKLREEAAINSIQTGVHSPGQFRVIGTLQNSEDFARPFNCPRNSYLNPVNKCSVW